MPAQGHATISHYNMKYILLSALVCISAAVFYTASAKKPAPKLKPNVLLILADDFGVGDFSSLNNGLSRTPNLDKLKQESVWFNEAYSGSAVCAPARACLLTGKYPHRTGVVSLSLENEPELTSLKTGEVTVGDMFGENGYNTALIGKWHLGIRPAYHPMKRGFQEFAGFMGPDVKHYYKFKLDINGTYQDYSDGKSYLTDVLTEKALDYIDRHKRSPFFLHLAYYAPHRPLGAPQKLIDYYLSKGLDQKTAKVYAMIEVMDTGIGQIMKKLDDLGIRENTVVIFASDNGPDPLVGERFNMDLRGRKYSVYEGGIRVPLMFSWKGTLKPSENNDRAHFTDIIPTLKDICSINIKPEVAMQLDGGSLYHSLLGKSNTALPKVRYWQWNRGKPFYSHNAAVREGEWKLVKPPQTTEAIQAESSEKPVLYNLNTDPQETRDVSAENITTYKHLEKLLDEWSTKVEADRIKKPK